MMRIVNQDRRYLIPELSLTAFMGQQGFAPTAIDELVVYLRSSHKNPNLWGQFKAPWTVYLYTKGEPASEVGNTLLHELRHYWQLLQQREAYAKALLEYEQIKRRRVRQDFYYAHIFLGQELSPESHIVYYDRPREQDARAFADLHESEHLLVLPQQVFAVLLPLPLAQVCEDALLTWLKRLGGQLLKRKRDAVVYYLTADDIERLVRFFQRQGAGRVILAENARGIPIAKLQGNGAATIVPYPVALIPVERPVLSTPLACANAPHE